MHCTLSSTSLCAHLAQAPCVAFASHRFNLPQLPPACALASNACRALAGKRQVLMQATDALTKITQVGTTMRTSQGKFKLLGLQGPLEGFFLSEAQHSLQRFNALLALLIHERGLSQPTNLVRTTTSAQTPCQPAML